jgi:hypothetical protein
VDKERRSDKQRGGEEGREIEREVGGERKRERIIMGDR